MIVLKQYRDPWMAERFTEEIGFYNREFYCLDNFSSFKIKYHDYLYSSVEEAYQAQGFIDSAPEIAEKIMKSGSAHEAKLIAHYYADLRRKDWNEVKIAIMEELLRIKLAQHPYVRKKLMETQDYILVEDSPTDGFYGCGRNRDGLNVLGHLWMKLREELKAADFRAEEDIYELKKKWPNVINYVKMKNDINEIAFKTWLKPLEIIGVREDCLTLLVPEASIGKAYLKKRFYKLLKDAIELTYGKEYEIEFYCES